MTRLAVVIPSRGRPAKALEAVACVGAMSTTDPQVIVVIDEDDSTRDEYVERLDGLPRVCVIHSNMFGLGAQLGTGHVGAVNMGATFALIAVNGLPAPEAVAKLDDDHRPRHHGWDERMLDALAAMGGGVVYADDGFQRVNLPTAFAMSADLVGALGWVMPPAIQHLYSDNAVKVIGETLRRLRYLPDVLVEHMHPHAGKAPPDEHYARVNSPEQYERDLAAFHRWRHEWYTIDMGRVREALGW